MALDMEGIDEQVSAIHCLGTLSLYCAGLMQPYIEQVVAQLQKVCQYAHENVRYHTCLSLTQIGFGIVKLNLGKQDTDEKLEWKGGLPVQEPLPADAKTYIDNILMPHFTNLLKEEMEKEVVEKVLENIRDMAEEMGPGGICDHLDFIVGYIELLLEKKAPCQTGVSGEDGQGPKDAAVEEEDDDSDEDDDEDLDHDEIILGNATDLVVALAKCLQDSFLPYL